MKLRRKLTYLLEDCFDATEKTARVRIYRHRHTVLIDSEVDGKLTQAEVSLRQLAYMLRNADKLNRE